MSDAPDRELLRAFRSDEATLDPERRARIDARVGAAIAGELLLEPDESASTAARGAARWRGWAIAGVAMVATVLVAVLFLRGGDETGEVRVMSAPPTAEALVQQVAQSPTAVLEPGQLLHRTTTNATKQASGPLLGDKFVDDYWTDVDGSVRQRATSGVTFTETGTSLLASGGEKVTENWEGWGISTFTQPEVDALPSSPSELEAAIESRAHFRDDDRSPFFGTLAAIASSPTTPASVRAAVVQLMVDSSSSYDPEPTDVPDELADIEVVALVLDIPGGPMTVWVDANSGLVVGHGTQWYTATMRAEIVTGTL